MDQVPSTALSTDSWTATHKVHHRRLDCCRRRLRLQPAPPPRWKAATRPSNSARPCALRCVKRVSSMRGASRESLHALETGLSLCSSPAYTNTACTAPHMNGTSCNIDGVAQFPGPPTGTWSRALQSATLAGLSDRDQRDELQGTSSIPAARFGAIELHPRVSPQSKPVGRIKLTHPFQRGDDVCVVQTRRDGLTVPELGLHLLKRGLLGKGIQCGH